METVNTTEITMNADEIKQAVFEWLYEREIISCTFDKANIRFNDDIQTHSITVTQTS